jgi:hypothetical protein
MAQSSKNLQLGKGELWFAPFQTGTQISTGFEFLGNCPAFTLNATVEKLDHYNSTGGVRQKDESVMLTKDVTGTITCDDIRPANIARFIGADSSTKTDAGSTGDTFTIASTVQGYRYQIGASAANPSGDRQITVTTVADGTPTTYAVTDDYIVYPELGMIEIVEDGAIVDGTELTITYDVAAHSRSVFVTSDDDVEGELKFIADNPVGLNIDYYLPWVKLTPNGEFSLITEEWATLPFNLECLRRGNLAMLYGDGRAVLP